MICIKVGLPNKLSSTFNRNVLQKSIGVTFKDRISESSRIYRWVALECRNVQRTPQNIRETSKIQRTQQNLLKPVEFSNDSPANAVQQFRKWQKSHIWICKFLSFLNPDMHWSLDTAMFPKTELSEVIMLECAVYLEYSMLQSSVPVRALSKCAIPFLHNIYLIECSYQTIKSHRSSYKLYTKATTMIEIYDGWAMNLDWSCVSAV